ncbi:hypothetical protein CPC16_006932, partial [Podila verticillata]
PLSRSPTRNASDWSGRPARPLSASNGPTKSRPTRLLRKSRKLRRLLRRLRQSPSLISARSLSRSSPSMLKLPRARRSSRLSLRRAPSLVRSARSLVLSSLEILPPPWGMALRWSKVTVSAVVKNPLHQARSLYLARHRQANPLLLNLSRTTPTS